MLNIRVRQLAVLFPHFRRQGIVDGAIYHGLRSIEKKEELGKLG